jgi:GT2 family glycosyltransferase
VGDLQVVIVEDPPFDHAEKILNEFNDNRITYVRNKRHDGISRSRNRSIEMANGEYVFFTDADCVVSSDWVEQGLRSLQKLDYVGAEGRTFYVSQEYKPTLSDVVIENRRGGRYLTCNIAYRKSIIEHIGGFDERYVRGADVDLALRAMNLGAIHFNPMMRVYHQKVTRAGFEYVRTAERVKNRVIRYKRFGKSGLPKGSLAWRIYSPRRLVGIVVPPLVLVDPLLHRRCKTKADLRVLPFVYLRLVWERLSLWSMCAKEKAYLI